MQLWSFQSTCCWPWTEAGHDGYVAYPPAPLRVQGHRGRRGWCPHALCGFRLLSTLQHPYLFAISHEHQGLGQHQECTRLSYRGVPSTHQDLPVQLLLPEIPASKRESLLGIRVLAEQGPEHMEAHATHLLCSRTEANFVPPTKWYFRKSE